MSEITAIERKIHRLKKDLQPLNERFEMILKEAEKKQLEITHLQQRLDLSIEIARGENGGEAVSKLQMVVLKSQQRRGIKIK